MTSSAIGQSDLPARLLADLLADPLVGAIFLCRPGMWRRGPYRWRVGSRYLSERGKGQKNS